MFWNLWKSTSSFGNLEVQDNVFRVAGALLGTYLTALPPPASRRHHCSQGFTPQCHSVRFLQRLQHYYTLPGCNDSWNQRIHKSSPWDSCFQSKHPIHNTDKFCWQLVMHPAHLPAHYQRPMSVAASRTVLRLSHLARWKHSWPEFRLLLFQGRAICLSFMVLTFLTITAALWACALTGTLSYLQLFFSLKCTCCIALSTLALFIVNLYKCYQSVFHRFSVMPNKLVLYFKIWSYINPQGTDRKQLHSLLKYMNGLYHIYRDLVLFWNILAWVSTIFIILSTTAFQDPTRMVF